MKRIELTPENNKARVYEVPAITNANKQSIVLRHLDEIEIVSQSELNEAKVKQLQVFMDVEEVRKYIRRHLQSKGKYSNQNVFVITAYGDVFTV